MPGRRVFLLALLIALGGVLGVVALRDGSADIPVAAEPPPPRSEPERSTPTPAPAPVTAARAGAGPAPRSGDADELRRTPAPTTSTPGEVAIRLGPPFRSGEVVTLRLERDRHEPIPLQRGFAADTGEAVFRASAPPGIWRVVVARGPGDPTDVAVSLRWVVDLPDEITVTAGDAATAWLRLDEALDAPQRARATVVGTAFVDGVPAADCTVQIAPLGGLRAARVAADGSFRIDDAPAGLGALQLLRPIVERAEAATAELIHRAAGPSRDFAGGIAERQGADAVQLLAEQRIVPARGETLRVDLHTRTASIAGVVLGPDGRGRPAEVTLQAARATDVVGMAHRPQFVATTGPTGAFALAGLGPGTWLLRAKGDAGATPPGRTLPVDVAPGAARSDVVLNLVRHAAVRGRVLVAELRAGNHLELRGPTHRTTHVDPDTGAFQVEAMPPGKYGAILVRAEDADVPLEPTIEVRGADLSGVELRPR